MKTLDNYFQQAEVFAPQKFDDHIELTLPILLDCCKNCLVLAIKPTDTGYTVSNVEGLFERQNETAEIYLRQFLDIFNEFDSDLRATDYRIYKYFDDDVSIACAIDETIRFFMEFDEFIANQPTQ